MAGSVNKVVLVGRLGKDPEVRTAKDGSKIVNLTLATSEVWNDRASGERKEKTEWHRVVIFDERIGDVAERFLKKGSQAYFEGSLQTRKWTDQGGQERHTTEVVIKKFKGELVLIDSQGGNNHANGEGGGFGNQRRAANAGPSQGHRRPELRPGGGWSPRPNGGSLDEEIPF